MPKRGTHCSASRPGAASAWAGGDRRRGGRDPGARLAGRGGVAAAGSAAGLASAETPAARTSLSVDLESGVRDPGRPLPGSPRNARGPDDPSGTFIYRKGRYTPLEGAPGAPLTAHLGLNNGGRIVGSYAVDGSTLLRGFVRSGRGDYEGFRMRVETAVDWRDPGFRPRRRSRRCALATLRVKPEAGVEELTILFT
jgi:hypothetical protein